MKGFARASARLYRALTLLYPRTFRAAYASDMVREFEESLIEAIRESGWYGALAEWRRTLLDWFSTVIKQHWEEMARGNAPVPAGTGVLGSVMYGNQMGWEERVMELLREIRFTAFRVVRARGYTAAFVLTLGLGIGANTAIFSLINGVLLKPLPHADGDRLVYLRQSADLTDVDNALFSVPEILDYRTRVTSFDGVAEHSALTFTLLGMEEPRSVRAGIVTGNYFSLMGLGAELGRTLDDRDDGPAAPPVMMLTHDFWSRVFGSDQSVIGRTYTIGERSVEVVGVLEPAPPYPEATDIFVNMVTSPHHMGASMNHDRTHRMTEVFARLASGATLEAANTEVQQISAGLHTEFPEAYDAGAGYAVRLNSLRDQLTTRARPTLLILLGVTFFVLIIACANVANLTLTRVVKRERELAIRASLGATRWTLRRELLIESLILSVMGGGLGILVAGTGLGALVAFTERFTERASEITVDGTVLSFALVVAVGAAILFAMIPRVPDGDRAGAIPGGRGVTGGLARKEVQRALVVAQVSVCFVLLVGAGLLGRTLLAIQMVDPGFDAENVLTMEIPTPLQGQDEDELRSYYQTITERVQALPGVLSAALSTVVPLSGSTSSAFGTFEFTFENQEVVPGQPAPRADFRPVSPEYFQTMGLRLVRGRLFDATDDRDAARVVIINQSLAERYFPDEDPIGRRLAWTDNVIRFLGINDGLHTIVGVVSDARDYGLDKAVLDAVFHPFAQEVWASSLLIRTGSSPEVVARPVMDVIRNLDSDQPIEKVKTLEAVRAESLTSRRLNATLIGGFALLAMVIAAVGVFGVLAFSVSQRTREFGVRTALGASVNDVVRTVVREGLMLTGIGLLVGGVAALGMSSFLDSLLFEVTPRDPITFVFVAVVLTAVAVTASWLPARRASRVDPVEALRAE